MKFADFLISEDINEGGLNEGSNEIVKFRDRIIKECKQLIKHLENGRFSQAIGLSKELSDKIIQLKLDSANAKGVVQEGLVEDDALTNFQMTYDDRLASVSKQKDKLEVKYFQRYDIKPEDRKAVMNLAKKINYSGSITQEGQTLVVKAR